MRAGARPMEFKLDLDRNAHPNVATDAYTIAEGRAALGDAASRGSALAGRGAALARSGAGKAASATKAGARAAGAAAWAGGKYTLEQARAYKKKWHNWLYERPGHQNFFLLITNVLYLALTLTALILTVIVVNEHVDDFKRNEFALHKDPITGEVKQYSPCGMPTPDSMYLLQALGALPAAGFDGAALEPDYKNWMQKVDRALCSRIVPGHPEGLPAYSDDIGVCKGNTYVDYGTVHAEELLAIGYLMDNQAIAPNKDDVNDQTLIDQKNALLETLTCIQKKNDLGQEPYYTKHLREAYGDLKTRVARAYVAAMPAFARYQNERAACQEPSQYKDPFDSYCAHSCHLRVELERAAADQTLMYDSGTVMPPGTTFTKQLYRLLALSLAGYYDRYYNDGVCFRNVEIDPDVATNPSGTNTLTALQFCQNSMDFTYTGATDPVTGTAGVTAYSQQNHKITVSEECGADYGTNPPPSPAPPVYRTNEAVSSDLAAHACAATLQYGLFEQGRLFGIPDVLAPFVLDTRVHPNIHFIGAWIYNAMYVNPVKMAGDLLADPKSKLEMYIAYRLSSTSIWAILVANVAGYMMVRALAPTIVHILKFLGFTTNVIKHKDPNGPYGDIYEDIVLVRPQIGWPVYLATFVTLLAIYWILWVDPATQSHYYISTTCEDWHGLGVQVPSGAFATTWGKRRYARFGEHLIGILLAITVVLIVFIQVVGKTFVPYEAKKEDAKVKEGETARLDTVALIMIGFALVIQILFITQSIISGDAWYEAIKASDNDHAMLQTFTKDVIMSVWAAFWTSASIAWYRQKWAVDKLNFIIQLVWMASALLLLWMPVFQSAALLSNEIDAAFSDGKGTTDQRRLIVYIFIYSFSAIWTVVLGIRLKAMWDALPERADAVANSTWARLKREREKKLAYIRGIELAAERADAADALGIPDISGTGSKGRFKFDLSSMPLGPEGIPVMPARKKEAGYMPLLPRQ